MKDLLQLEDLRVFCLVVRKGGFAAAAEAMPASPAYVSKRIRVLEHSLGCRLLNRTTRRIALTEQGERIHDWAEKILQDVEQMSVEIGAARQQPRGMMRISSSFGFGRVHLAPALGELARHYPELSIRLELADCLIDLAQEGIDLDIRVGNEIAPQLLARKLVDNRRILCAAPDYLSRHGTPTRLEALNQHNCLVIKERDHPFGVWRLTGPQGEHCIRVNGALAANHGEVVHQWALQGHGIMLRSLWDVAGELERGELVQVLPDYYLQADIWAVYPEKLASSAKLRVCVEFFQQYFRSGKLA
ncbi:LysR family transcriptional regulator [Aquitalea sp. LB_tupeE]|uniref:LysR family transcriptional regulator n=1 Tax=Aquitalea sp. LB_tupeE TaxID=2748078 RepID=UPI0015BA5809|nr:LysR family transcriptional regulator [Aquitalea sp. LB_tupeE]NWK78593.1 LysR family transcriptional regulator [Aquitalea sp. LB_tupeE]